MTNNNTTKTKNKTKVKTKNQRMARRSTNLATVAPSAISGIISSPSYSMTSSQSGQVVRLKGRDILGTLTAGGIPSTTIVGVFDMNPACWESSRLSMLARTFEKYRFESFTATYVPALPTTASGFAVIYYEPEIYDSIATTVVQGLTHFNSSASPTWSPTQITFKRPAEDPTAYLCTEKTGVERALLSQGKICVLSDSTTTSSGLITIDYDITFMYPEVEFGYSGTQYTQTLLNLNAAANGIISALPAFPTVNIKLIELVLQEPFSNLFVNVAGNPYNFNPGTVIYSAWDGGAWRLFPDIASALAKSGALFSVPALAAVLFNVLGRRLVAPPL